MPRDAFRFLQRQLLAFAGCFKVCISKPSRNLPHRISNVRTGLVISHWFVPTVRKS